VSGRFLISRRCEAFAPGAVVRQGEAYPQVEPSALLGLLLGTGVLGVAELTRSKRKLGPEVPNSRRSRLDFYGSLIRTRA